MRLRNIILILLATGSISLSAFTIREALSTVNKDFLGVLPYKNLFIGPFTQKHWEGGKLGLSYHDRITEIRPAGDGRRIQAKILRNQTETTVYLSPSKLSSDDVFQIFAPLFGTGIAFLIIGMLALLITPPPQGVFPFVLYCAAVGTYLLTAYDFHTTYRLTSLLLLSFSFIPPSVIHLATTFPTSIFQREIRKWLILGGYILAAILFLPYFLWFETRPGAWRHIELAFFTYLSVSYVLWVTAMIYRVVTTKDLQIRQQCKIILVPLIPAFGVVFAVSWAVFIFEANLSLNIIAPVCLVFPAAIAYAMLRNNLFLVDRLEAEVKERTNRLRTAESELNEAHKMAAVGLLAAGTAHEIGNAMNLISSNLPVLKKYVDRFKNLVTELADHPDVKGWKNEADFDFMQRDLGELFSNLEHGALRANDIARDLKDFARPQAAVQGEFDLIRAIETTLRLLKPKLGDRIRVSTRFSPIPRLQGAPGGIHQVLVNLLLNAIESIEASGEIHIAVDSSPDNAIQIQIRDTGKGIPPENISRIFEPFFTTKSGGTGLGLSVSYGIVRAHGGKLEIQSEPGKGTTVTLRLPVQA